MEADGEAMPVSFYGSKLNQINNSKIVIETIHNYLSKEYIGNDIRMYCSLFTNLNEISDKTVVDYINWLEIHQIILMLKNI